MIALSNNMHRIINSDCIDALAQIADQSIDAVITDPPYPEIDRDYGRMSEPEWHAMMDAVATHCKRVLKPTGSAVFVLQPNSKKVGEMRLWLWEFMVRTAKEWNLIQDVYWNNTSAIPTAHCRRDRGLLRSAVKYCLWFGPHDCYRNQDAVLTAPSAKTLKMYAVNKDRVSPSGHTIDMARMRRTLDERGGVVPTNALPFGSGKSSGAYGHGAGTPYHLCEWWVRYITKPGHTILDPFAGAGTIGVAAVKNGRSYVGIEKHKPYCDIAELRISGVTQ